jgi:NADH:ubiquinone oxidoreductase subunit F (NADH-binding)
VSAGTATRRSMPAPAATSLPRLLAGIRSDGRPVSLSEHLHRHGPLPAPRRGGPDVALVELVEASGLRGRGGGSFPTGRKLRAVASAGRRSVVLVNGVEAEPISSKDHVLLAYDPHLVLDGAAVAAAAVGARDVFVAVNAAAGNTFSTVRGAIAERANAERITFHAVAVPDRFVAGEETALVSFVDGGPPKPTFTPPRPFEKGVGGAPTLVQNAETLAHLALIARYGPDWFRGVGTRDEPGSALVTLNGAVERPGVYEIPLGLPMRELLAWAGGPRAPISAYLIGGYFGTWLAAGDAESALLVDSDLRRWQASLGARAIFALPETTCGVAETARLARYLADQSVRQCGPCVHGLDALAKALERLARANTKEQESRLPRWLDQIAGRGACHHPDGAVRLVRSALHVFADECALHMRGSCTGRGGPLLPTSGRKRR